MMKAEEASRKEWSTTTSICQVAGPSPRLQAVLPEYVFRTRINKIICPVQSGSCKRAKRNIDEIVETFEGKVMDPHEIQSLSKHSLLNLATGSKEASMALQVGLEVAPNESIASVCRFVSTLVPKLIFDKYGNYVIQRLALKNEKFKKVIQNYCRQHFANCVCNEFSSRVLETLFESDATFAGQCVGLFQSNLESLVNCFPAAFAVKSAIKNSPQGKLSSLFHTLFEQSIPNNKFYKRITSVFLECCSQEDLIRAGEHLYSTYPVSHFLSDKSSVQILQASLVRGCPNAYNSIINSLRNSFIETIKLKHFEFVVRQISSLASRQPELAMLKNELSRRTIVEWTAMAHSASLYSTFSSLITLLHQDPTSLQPMTQAHAGTAVACPCKNEPSPIHPFY